jgi:DNA-binding CsgD family transcriptional regulator
MKELQQEMYDLFVSGLTLDEIAADFGVSVDDVYQTIRWFKNM